MNDKNDDSTTNTEMTRPETEQVMPNHASQNK